MSTSEYTINGRYRVSLTEAEADKIGLLDAAFADHRKEMALVKRRERDRRRRAASAKHRLNPNR